MLPWLALLPRVANLLMASGLGRFFTARVAGIVDAPALDPKLAVHRLRQHGIPISDLAALRKLPKIPRVVLILQDPFTTFYEPNVLEASCLLLRKLGFEPHVLPYFENGKALHIKGFVHAFHKVVERNSKVLKQVAATGFPMLGVEPAVAGLRVSVLPGGCSGFKYSLNIEEAALEDDMVQEVNGIRVFVDGFSAQYLSGVTVDYVTSMQGSGFTFSNPNASGGCGCGSSFTV